MIFGLTMEKLILIGLIAVVLIGPERLPAAAESLRRAIVHLRGLAKTAQERVRDELGPEVTDVDWQRLDPRRYDPRRIVREALFADAEPIASTSTPTPTPTPTSGAGGGRAGSVADTGSDRSADQGEEPAEARADTVLSADSTRRTAA